MLFLQVDAHLIYNTEQAFTSKSDPLQKVVDAASEVKPLDPLQYDLEGLGRRDLVPFPPSASIHELATEVGRKNQSIHSRLTDGDAAHEVQLLGAIAGVKSGDVLTSHSIGLGMGLNEVFVDLRQLYSCLSADKGNIVLSPAYQLVFSLRSITCLWVVCHRCDREALTRESGKIATALRSLGGFSIVAIENHISKGVPFARTRHRHCADYSVSAFKYVIVAGLGEKVGEQINRG